MSSDARYSPHSLILLSKGIVAKDVTDQQPANTYMNLENAEERLETAISSRYGTQIINRSASGSGTSNYPLSNTIVSLSKLISQGSPYRYAFDSTGAMYRRAGATQGAYTSVESGFSGKPVTTLVTNCYASSQPYLFVADLNQMVKDIGTGTPTQWGILPPNHTANAFPYAPLLTIIDNFAITTTTYTSGGFSSSAGWEYAWSSISGSPGVTAASGVKISDFVEALGVGTIALPEYHAPPQEPDITCPPGRRVTDYGVKMYGFPSVGTNGAVVYVTVIVNLLSVSNYDAPRAAEINPQYSYNDGTDWVSFGPSIFIEDGLVNTYSITCNAAITGLSNVTSIQVRVVSTLDARGGIEDGLEISYEIPLGGCYVQVQSPSAYGTVSTGMLAIPATAPTGTFAALGIASVSSQEVSGVPSLEIATTQAHGLTGTPNISIYGCSNNLLNGYYTVNSIPTSTTFTVPFPAIGQVALGSSVGGFIYGAQSAPGGVIASGFFSVPYPSQMTLYGAYQQAALPNNDTYYFGSWEGTVAQNSTAWFNQAYNNPIDLDNGGAITEEDLIVLTVLVEDPAAISEIRLQFNPGINHAPSDSTQQANYYYKSISPAYYQQGVQGLEDAYTAQAQQSFANSLGLTTTSSGIPSIVNQLQPVNISTGKNAWISVYMRRGDFVAVGKAGQAGLDWTTILGYTVTITTNTVGSSVVACNALYLQWGYGPSSYGGSGYEYMYTYYNANTQTESNPSPLQAFSEQFGGITSKSPLIVLRQAVQVAGYYSADPQVTHVNVYRRGGSVNEFRFVGNITNTLPNSGSSQGQFTYKDVLSDAAVIQSKPLQFDNDPPVTSSLQSPIVTALSAGVPTLNYAYSLSQATSVSVQNNLAVFSVGQIVDVGYPQNIEQVRVVTGGTGSFSAVFRLLHNAGDPVVVYSVPAMPCNICATAYGRTWLAGDTNNPHYLYFSKVGNPESFPPENYIPCGSPQYPITAIVNFRGTLVVSTTNTWYMIVNGATPYAQPTGSKHGCQSDQGWCQTENSIWYQAIDGIREFTGSPGAYRTAMVECLFGVTTAPSGSTPVALVDTSALSSNSMAFNNNNVFLSYLGQDGNRHRLIFNTTFGGRIRNDDIAATAMYQEEDTNKLIVARPITVNGTVGNYICQDRVGDYDDGGWSTGTTPTLTQNGIVTTIQIPYQDLGRPAEQKQWNMVELDCNTNGQNVTVQMVFDDGTSPITLATVNTSQREKVSLIVNSGEGQASYRYSLIISGTFTVAPIFYQTLIHATILPHADTSRDTYWIKMGINDSKFVKQGWFDYTASASISVSLYADGSSNPYFTFTLPASSQRLTVRQRFGNVNPGASAQMLRTFRMVMTSTGDFQMYQEPMLEWKSITQGSTYRRTEIIL